MNVKTVIYWAVRLIAAVIMLQTLYFKFSGAEESIYIFSSLGMEPWGRIGVGVVELIASILLLITPIAWIGALLALGAMCGAIFFHLFILGIEVRGDGGYLFLLAVIVAICSLYVLFVNVDKIKTILNWRKATA
jgi:putative oxidoreductase